MQSKYQTFPQQSMQWLLFGALLFIAVIWHNTSPSPTAFDVKHISVDDATALIERGATVVDVRSKGAYEDAHIPGAVSMPLADIDKQAASITADKSQPMVVYCGDGQTIGPEATAKLNALGFTQAANLTGGFKTWQSSGKAIEKS